MKRIFTLWVVVIVFASLFVTETGAQRGMGQAGNNGWGKNSGYNRMYNVNTVETIKGIVITVDKIAPMKGMSPGIHLLVKTAKETLSVHLGPQWYMEKQSVQIKVNENIKIQGSRIAMDGKPVIIADKITIGNKEIKLRDINGIPLWSGRGSR
jgi:hypothetical protein